MRAQPYQISGTPQSIKKRGILSDVSAHPFGCLGGYFGEKLVAKPQANQ